MIHFHPLRIKKVQKETDDCVSISFHVPEDLRDLFRFKHGQSLTIRTQLNGQEVRRTYSICSSPYDDDMRVAVKKVEGGLFSTFANDKLKAGDIIDVMPPVGTFHTELHPGNQKNYVAFAAGSGITPILSIIKTTLITERESSFTLIYGNRTKNSIIFKEELEALKDKFMDRFRVYHVLSREKTESEINSGRLDEQKIELFFDKLVAIDSIDHFFICGPEEMIFCIRDLLLKNNIPADRIHFELFTIPGQKKSTVDTKPVAGTASGPQSRISVKLDGIVFDFDLAQGGQSILDAALAQGADLPYACKGGVCCTCKAKLVEGKVRMDVNWGLEPDEIEKGFILTCQSHPETDKVMVDFDVK